MRITILYDKSITPREISFEKTEEIDMELIARILGKVIGAEGKQAVCDFTFMNIRPMEVELQTATDGIKYFKFKAEVNLLERIIHHTVGNHFHMLKEELALEIFKQYDR